MRRIWTPRWVLVHALALVLVVTFLWLGWWQFGRAASGNLLSYGYSIQWPAFAAFVIFVWIKEIRGTLRRPGQDDADHPSPDHPGPAAVPPGLTSAGSEATGARRERGAQKAAGPARAETSARNRATAKSRASARGTAYDDSDDPQLAAYNRYLAWLNANPHANPADYPGN